MRKFLCRTTVLLSFALLGGVSVSTVLPEHAAIAAPKILQDPRAIVAEFYRITAGPLGKYNRPSAFFDAKVRKLYFSASLQKAIAAMERKSKTHDDVILDIDPITNSQDPSVKNLSITAESNSGSRTTVDAKFWSFDEKAPSIVRYDFIKEGSAWKLDNIRGAHGDDTKLSWSLRKLIGG